MEPQAKDVLILFILRGARLHESEMQTPAAVFLEILVCNLSVSRKNENGTEERHGTLTMPSLALATDAAVYDVPTFDVPKT